MTAGAIDLKRPRIASATWLLLWVTAAIWVCHVLATAWPYVNLMPQWLLVIAVPGILFRTFDLVWMQAVGQRVSGWKRVLARTLALPAGVLAAAGMWSAMDGISMARFERAMTPVLGQVHANAAAPCPPALQYSIPPDVAAYLEQSNAPRAPADLHYDGRRFVLTLGGRSMDIDGSTLFYDSRSRQWRKVHNDRLNESGELVVLTKGLEACRIALR